MRREFVNGLWYYTYVIDKVSGAQRDSLVFAGNNYVLYNNKWSKLWTAESNALGKTTEGSTGINYPYMRYADVLLMYAEVANELNDGPTDKAIECLRKVHSRAFRSTADGDAAFIADAQNSKENFQKAVLDERKWEFAGENSRWRDLVRTNTYAEELMYSFLRYYSVSMQSATSMTGYEDAINEHDGLMYIDNLPSKMFFHKYQADEVQSPVLKRLFKNQFYGYVFDSSFEFIQKYPNQSLPSLRITNTYKKAASDPVTSQITNYGFAAKAWSNANVYEWGDTSNGVAKNECKYSFAGYILCDDSNNLYIVRDGAMTPFPSTIPNVSELPAVRYILPYPNRVILRSAGIYKNYYGY